MQNVFCLVFSLVALHSLYCCGGCSSHIVRKHAVVYSVHQFQPITQTLKAIAHVGVFKPVALHYPGNAGLNICLPILTVVFDLQ